MYVCGPTVYGPPHLGHGRFSLVFDILRRYLTWCGQRVVYVSNITDIDDKIIARAAEEGRPWTEVVAEFEGVWWDAMAAIGVQRPDHEPHATAYVDRMVSLIANLVAEDRAYLTDDGVYLSVADVDGYGLLAHQSLDELLAGGGDREVVGGSGKRHPADFALWKLAKPGEPSWPAPWGDGRPCSATASTCTAADSTWPFPTTRTNVPRPWRRAGSSPGTGCTTGSSRWPARRCRSRSTTSRRSPNSSSVTTRGRTGCSCSRRTTGRRSR
jgi:cysteinyl-tRNA synthetase